MAELADAAGSGILNGEPGEVRTPDLEFRKLLLYPSELQAHNYIVPKNCTQFCTQLARLLPIFGADTPILRSLSR